MKKSQKVVPISRELDAIEYLDKFFALRNRPAIYQQKLKSARRIKWGYLNIEDARRVSFALKRKNIPHDLEVHDGSSGTLMIGVHRVSGYANIRLFFRLPLTLGKARERIKRRALRLGFENPKPVRKKVKAEPKIKIIAVKLVYEIDGKQREISIPI
jgi:hypothetical protein